MSNEMLIALITFAFVTAVTPGPNNLLLLASGANFGVRRSLRHLIGISLGHLLMVSAVGLGLGQLFRLYPPLYDVLRIVGASYLLYLAWRTANAAPPPNDPKSGGKPFTLVQAVAFQWVNPKAWFMALGAITTYLPAEPSVLQVLYLASIFALVNCPSCSVWLFAGSLLRKALQNPRTLRILNIGMALLLVISLYPILQLPTFVN